MDYYTYMINQTAHDRPLLPAMQADSRIGELERELAGALMMIAVQRQVIAEKDEVIRAAIRRGR